MKIMLMFQHREEGLSFWGFRSRSISFQHREEGLSFWGFRSRSISKVSLVSRTSACDAHVCTGFSLCSP